MIKIQKTILGLAMAIMCIASYTTLYAQETADSTEAKTPATVKKQAPAVELREVCGLVLDAATHEPIDGARVQAYGDPQYSVLTEDDGTYWLKLPTYTRSVYVTVPGYNDIQIALSDEQRVQNAEMYSSSFNSYYTPTTNITSYSKVEIDMTSATSIDSEIENKLGGDIHTINRTGVQGQGIAMMIRGINSLNLNAQPLIVFDGMFMDLQLDRTSIHDGFFNNILAGIDPEDIESVEVLKNATSLYGSRGANGVVIINTKRGKSMATKINANIYGGFELAPSYIDMMNASQYKTYASDLIGTTEYGLKYGTGSNAIPFLNDNKNYYWYPMYNNNTDWSDGLYHTAFTQNYKVNVQGGDDVAMYNLSLGYTDAQSTAKNNDFSRLNIRFNTDIKMFRNLSTQLDISYSRMTYDLRDNGWAETYNSSSISSPNVLGLIQAPFLSKYGYYTGDDMKLHLSSLYAGKYVDDDNYPFGFASRFGSNTALGNPYWYLENGDGVNKNTQQVTQFNLNVMPKWEINRHLYVTDRFAYQLNRSNEKYFLPVAGSPIYNLEGLGDITSVVKSLFGKETSVFNDFRINWSNKYGSHQVAAFGGFRFTNNSYDDNHLTGYNAGNDKMPDFKGSLDFINVEGVNDQWRNLAYYVHGDYNYKNTYYVDFTMAAESSSRFGKETSEGIKLFGVKWGLFPSLQLGWVMSNEKWLQRYKGVNYLKFTLGYDESGNDAIPYSASRTYFQSTPYLNTAIGLQLVNIENPEIQWETTRRFNAGLSGSFFNNRIHAGLEFYISTTSNLLTLKQNNYMTGLDSYWTNDGSLRNIGADVHVNAIIINKKDFKWELGATLGHYKNELRNLPSENLVKVYGGEIMMREGDPVGLFWGYKTAGVFSTDAEASTAYNNSDYLKYPTGIEANPYKNFSAGDVHFLDITSDGVIDEGDKTVIGDPNPDVYGNIFTTFTYKRWTLGFTFKYSLGNDIYNYQRSQLESLNGFYNQTVAAVNRWSNEGQVTNMPKVCSTESDEWVNNERFSDRWIEDGSFLKLKKVRISYNWPLNLSWIQGITIWGECNNLFTISRYTGIDPEFSCGNSLKYQGIDAGLLPSSRSFFLGLRLNL
mgnify:CR=1 FL=1